VVKDQGPAGCQGDITVSHKLLKHSRWLRE